jgi:hypothetical protein
MLVSITSSAIAWGILALHLKSSHDDSWFYGFFKRMAKAALIVLGGQILTFFFIALLFSQVGRMRSEAQPSRQLQAPRPRSLRSLQARNAPKPA